MNNRIAFTFACAAALCASTALAGTLATDDSSLLGFWHGSVTFQGYLPDGVTPTGQTGTIDYAVYTAAQFRVVDFPGSGYTPTSNYVYAYQAFESGPAALTSLSIGLGPPYPEQDIGTFTGSDAAVESDMGLVGGQSPSSQLLIPGVSADWLFGAVPVAQGGSTMGLVFSSPHAPIWSTGSLIDGNVALADPLPTPGPSLLPVPYPEPSTMMLALCGVAGVAPSFLRRRLGCFSTRLRLRSSGAGNHQGARASNGAVRFSPTIARNGLIFLGGVRCAVNGLIALVQPARESTRSAAAAITWFDYDVTAGTGPIIFTPFSVIAVAIVCRLFSALAVFFAVSSAATSAPVLFKLAWSWLANSSTPVISR